MKNKSALISLILIALLIANFIEINQIKKHKDITQSILKIRDQCQDYIKQQSNYIRTQLRFENTRLTKDKLIYDEIGNEISITNMTKSTYPIVVLRISKLNCQTCIRELLGFLEKIFSEKKGRILLFWQIVMKLTHQNLLTLQNSLLAIIL